MYTTHCSPSFISETKGETKCRKVREGKRVLQCNETITFISHTQESLVPSTNHLAHANLKLKRVVVAIKDHACRQLHRDVSGDDEKTWRYKLGE